MASGELKDHIAQLSDVILARVHMYTFFYRIYQ